MKVLATKVDLLQYGWVKNVKTIPKSRLNIRIFSLIKSNHLLNQMQKSIKPTLKSKFLALQILKLL